MSDALVIEVVRKTVTVDCAVEEAFRIFTADAISWWPVETHSIHKTVSEIVFEPDVGGEVYEIGTNGERGHWATVLEWEPRQPAPRVEHPEAGRRADRGRGSLPARGCPYPGRAPSTAAGSAWRRAREKRDNYDSGWDLVLGKYVARI